jgi:hypothetical protein
MMALQGAGAPPDDAQGASGANDAFATMFAKMMAAKPKADSTDPAANGGSDLAGASGVAGASGAPVSADMSTLNQALSAGNVSAAQLAFQSLQTDLQPAQKPHHHFWNGSNQTGAQAASTPAATPATTGVQASSPDPGSAAGEMAASDPQMRTLLAGLTQ